MHVQLNVLQCLHEAGSHLVQFQRMSARQSAQEPVAFSRHTENRSSLVFRVRDTRQEALEFRAVDEFNRAIVLQAQAIGRIRNGRDRAYGSACNLQKQLVLLGLQTCMQRGTLAEEQKAAKFKAKIC